MRRLCTRTLVCTRNRQPAPKVARHQERSFDNVSYMSKKSDGLFEAFMGRKKDERVNIFGIVPKAEKQRVRQLHAAERTAQAAEDLAKTQKASSAADELTKLAKLRDQGVLTDAEFDVQKRRLLSGE
jgi:hypothetical protein